MEIGHLYSHPVHTWHTFPDEPEAWEDVETVYLVSECYERKTNNGKWEFECYQAFCLWDWEDRRFVDVFGGEYFYGLETSQNYRGHKLCWKIADLPPGMEKYATRLYTELCRQGATPFAEKEPGYWEVDPYDDPETRGLG